MPKDGNVNIVLGKDFSSVNIVECHGIQFLWFELRIEILAS